MQENSFQNFSALRIQALVDKNILLNNRKKMHFNSLLQTTNKNNLLQIFIGYDKENNPQGGVCFMIIEERVFIHTFCNALGKKYGLVYFLINQFIAEHAGQNLILDFMGSSIDGIRYRNLGFGSAESTYSAIHIRNILPLFKR